MIFQQRQLQHLFLRAAFGATPEEVLQLVGKERNEVLELLFKASESFKPIHYLPYPLNEREEQKGLGGFQILKMILQSRKDMEELNTEWLFKMTWTKSAMRERMTFFWHNHFACSAPFAYLMQEQNNLLRKHALGKFPDLLMAIAKDPAMLIFLNSQQNKKQHPNENFARELLELFTLGEGNYSERDIREAARAFTGWATNTKGQFVFNRTDHDEGIKEFMGHTGNFTGEDIIQIVLKDPRCAQFIATKVYRELVNPLVDEQKVDALADAFFQSGYDIRALLWQIFSSDWFYEEINIGVKIASPVELLVRLMKTVGMEGSTPGSILHLQKALGQVLFFPPNVAGWKGGTHWIDSSALLMRLNIPYALLNGKPLQVQNRPAFEEAQPEAARDAALKADWNVLLDQIPHDDAEQSYAALLQHLIQCDTTSIDQEVIFSNLAFLQGKRRSTVMAANLMSTPEFQLI